MALKWIRLYFFWLRLIACVKIQLHMLSYWNGLGNVDYHLNVAFTKYNQWRKEYKNSSKYSAWMYWSVSVKAKQLQISIKWQNAFWRHIEVKMWHIYSWSYNIHGFVPLKSINCVVSSIHELYSAYKLIAIIIQ